MKLLEISFIIFTVILFLSVVVILFYLLITGTSALMSARYECVFECQGINNLTNNIVCMC